MELTTNRRGTEYAIHEAGEITHKRCTSCGEVKEASSFYKSNTHVGGIKNHCNVCTDKYSYYWRKENKKLIKAYNQYYRIKKGKFRNGK